MWYPHAVWHHFSKCDRHHSGIFWKPRALEKRSVLLRKARGPSRTATAQKSGFWLQWKDRSGKMASVIQNWAWLPHLQYKESFLKNKNGLSVLQLFIKLQISVLSRENAKSISQEYPQSRMNPSHWLPSGLECIRLAVLIHICYSRHLAEAPLYCQAHHSRYQMSKICCFLNKNWDQSGYLH